MKDVHYKHRSLVTDLGFWLDQLNNPEMPPMMVELIGQRVAHHEVALGVDLLMERARYQADLAVASAVETVPLSPRQEPYLVPAAA